WRIASQGVSGASFLISGSKSVSRSRMESRMPSCSSAARIALTFAATQCLPGVESCQPFIELRGAIRVGGIAALLVDSIQPRPDSADEFGGLPHLQLAFVDLFGEFFQDGAREAVALARQAHFGEQELAVKTASAGSLQRGQPGHFGQSLLDCARTKQLLRIGPGISGRRPLRRR